MSNELADFEARGTTTPAPIREVGELPRLLLSTIATHAPVCKEGAHVDGIWKLSLALTCLQDMHSCFEATAGSNSEMLNRARIVLTRFFYEAFLEMKDYMESPKQGVQLLEDIAKTIPMEERGINQFHFKINGKEKILFQRELFKQVSNAFNNVYGELLEIASAIKLEEKSDTDGKFEVLEFEHHITTRVFNALLNITELIFAKNLSIRLDLNENTVGKGRKELREKDLIIEKPNSGFMLRPEVVAQYKANKRIAI